MKVKGLIFILCLPLFAVEAEKKKSNELMNFDGTVFEYFNSVNVSLKWHDYEAEIDDIEYENRTDIGSPSMSVRGIQHPDAYKNWSWNFRISPSIHLDRMQLKPTEADLAIDPTRANINARRFSILGNLRLTYHMPLGQLQGSFGYGPAFYEIDYKNDQPSRYPVEDLTKLEIVYIAFPYWDRVFVMTGPRLYFDDGAHWVWAVRIGFFWGDTKKKKKKFDLMEKLNLK